METNNKISNAVFIVSRYIFRFKDQQPWKAKDFVWIF